MSFKEFRERNPKSRQKKKDRPTSFKPKESKLTVEEANARREKIFARKAAPRALPVVTPVNDTVRPKGRSANGVSGNLA